MVSEDLVHYSRIRDEGDETDYGDIPEPVIVVDSIKKIEAPLEKFLY